MQLDLFSDDELVFAAASGQKLVWDVECYPNYFLVGFRSIDCGKVVYFELGDGFRCDLGKLEWVLNSFLLVDFNGNKYDVPITSLALAKPDTRVLQWGTDQLINQNARPQDILKPHKGKKLQVNHIDLIELVALRPSLKLLAGRLHARRLQDLPFPPGTMLSEDQIDIVRWYWVNDLDNTIELYKELLPDIVLREKMSARYSFDLRSKSDAQIAEAIISSQIKKITGQRHIQRPNIPEGAKYKYRAPAFISYQTPLLSWVLEQVRAAWFEVGPTGKVIIPPEIKSLAIQIAGGVYRMGNGGLHSSEKRIAHYSDEETILCDRDVASYYPRIILNCLLAPAHLGAPFLRVYNGLVIERLGAKTTGDKVAADGLKIVVNGSFGKLGSKYSVLYAPDLMIQVTITGQLSLLMLIERLELIGLPVVSANTDGIIIKCPKARQSEMESVVAQWERETGFETEETRYKAVYSRDVNNYFAVKEKPGKGTERFLDERLGVKVKGIYAERGSSRNSILAKNPTVQVCSDAVLQALANGVPVEQTIRECRDVRRFLIVRTVKGGAVKNGEYLGKAIRWYFAQGEEGEIVYAKSGNQVPRSTGARPLMELPAELPADIDYSWYETEAHKILKHVGFEVGEVEEEEADEDDEADE